MEDYLDWQSKISPTDIFASEEGISYPECFNGGYVYLSSLVEEKNRTVLKCCVNGQTQCITPKPYSLRTTINEYGGKPYWLVNDSVVFSNQSDQCLYQQEVVDGKMSSHLNRLTPMPNGIEKFSYSDVIYFSEGCYLAIVEHHICAQDASLNKCFIGLIDSSNPDQKPKVIADGADFYSNLAFDGQRNRLAWMQWDHPNMPWDQNLLFIAELGPEQEILSKRSVISNSSLCGESHCQLAFARNGRLFFSVDFSEAEEYADFWNIYVWCPITEVVSRVTFEDLEFGYPHWQYGDVRIVQVDDDHLVAIGSSPEGDSFYKVNVNTLNYECVYQTDSTLQSMSSDGQGRLVFIELPKETKLSLSELVFTADEVELNRLKSHGRVEFSVSAAQSISYKTRDGYDSHGFYYPPSNHHEVMTQPDAKPPVLVMVHGGPTARAYGHFDMQKQFWVSNGFAVFDVNHRGSSGYGRAYRDSLYGQWGERDISDVIDGISWLIEQGLVDPGRVCIRGKSAGGYAVLRALTEYPDVFKVGACYYGIGNLATLADITHKFEKHYTDRLVDEVFDNKTALKVTSNYYLRSPIFKVNHIQSAMIVFQGACDNVVPPLVAHEIVAKLKGNGVTHEYTEYAEEGHGFKQVKNNIDAWNKELSFYRKNLN